MKKILLLATLGLTCIACEEQGKGMDTDNTGKTTMNQNETEADRTTTQKIRQAIMSDDTLSANARTIRIITANGVVTIRGSVLSANEKEAIAKKIKEIAGVKRVDNQLEVPQNNP